MKIIDSNIWISFFNRDDVNHIQSEQILKECMGDTFCVTDFIISEVLTVLSQKASKEIANNFAEFVYNSSNVKIIYTSKVLFGNVLCFFIENDFSKLSFVDQSLLYLSKDFEVISFDKNLNKEMEAR